MVSRLDATIYFNKKYLSLLNNIYTTVTAGSSRVHIYFHVHQQKRPSEKVKCDETVKRMWINSWAAETDGFSLQRSCYSERMSEWTYTMRVDCWSTCDVIFSYTTEINDKSKLSSFFENVITNLG